MYIMYATEILLIIVDQPNDLKETKQLYIKVLYDLFLFFKYETR